jgi:tetratricopeptide (TPR) repeat protein
MDIILSVIKKINLEATMNAGKIILPEGMLKEINILALRRSLKSRNNLFMGKKMFKLLIIPLFIITNNIYSFDVDPVGNNVKDGVKSFKDGNFSNSLEKFNKAETGVPDDKRISFNKGTAYYKLGDFKSALNQFEKSAGNTNDPQLKAKSLYNMGNTHLKLGDKVSAMRSYLDAITVDPGYEPAKKNLDLLQRVEEKKNKEEENKGKGDDRDEDNNDQKKSIGKEEEGDSKNKSDLPKNEKMKREEAERILESARQDRIKRRKAQSKRSDRNEIFW